MASFNYVSCIKIAGTPILPPLVTEKDRAILAFYKKKAIQKEEELSRRKNQCIKTPDYTYQGHLSDSSTSDHDISEYSVETEKVMDFIRQALHDVGHSDVSLIQSKVFEELQKIKIPLRTASSDTLHLLEDLSLSEDREPSVNFADTPSTSARCFSIEKSVNEMKITPQECNGSQKQLSSFSSNSSINSHISVSLTKSDQKVSDIIDPQNETTPPKLIRRNSYTLDSPSPSVLQYLRSLNKSSSSSCENIDKKVVKNLNEVWNANTNGSSSNNNSFSSNTFDDRFESEKINDNNNDPVSIRSPTIGKASTIVFNPISSSKNKISTSTLNVTPEKQRAVIVIQAGIRGYLIRRLMKTNKVMELRNTIKDSLICALELHTEQNVSSADVNLHVRLIRQVTAACYELHAIFFEYTTREKMHLISLDREKLLSAERTKINLRRLRAIQSDDESRSNGITNVSRGKPRRPASLPLTRRGGSLTKSRR